MHAMLDDDDWMIATG